MNFEIQTSSYFDTEAKRLTKRHRSFVDDLVTFQNELLKKSVSRYGTNTRHPKDKNDNIVERPWEFWRCKGDNTYLCYFRGRGCHHSATTIR